MCAAPESSRNPTFSLHVQARIGSALVPRVWGIAQCVRATRTMPVETHGSSRLAAEKSLPDEARPVRRNPDSLEGSPDG